MDAKSRFKGGALEFVTQAVKADIRSGRWSAGEALDIAATMKKERVKPDKRTYDALLSCAATENAWLFAWAIFEDMIECGIQPTASSFLPLLEVYCPPAYPFTRELTPTRPKPSAPSQINGLSLTK